MFVVTVSVVRNGLFLSIPPKPGLKVGGKHNIKLLEGNEEGRRIEGTDLSEEKTRRMGGTFEKVQENMGGKGGGEGVYVAYERSFKRGTWGGGGQTKRKLLHISIFFSFL